MLFTKSLLNHPIYPSKPLSYWIKGGTWHPHPLTLLTSKDQYISPGRGQGPDCQVMGGITSLQQGSCREAEVIRMFPLAVV